MGNPGEATPMTDPPMTDTPTPDAPMTESPPPRPMPDTPTLDSNDGSLNPPPMPQGETPMPETTAPPTPTDPPASEPPATNPPSAETIPPAAPPDTAPPDTTPPSTTPPMTDSPMPPAGETPVPVPIPDPATPPDNSTTVPMPMPEPTNPPSDFPPPPAPMPEVPGVGPKSNTKYTLQQVNQAIAAASEHAKSFGLAAPELPEAERTKLKINLYRSLADLAEATTLLDDKTDNIKAARAASLALVQGYASDMAKLNQIGKLAGIWRKSAFRKTSGIVLTGRIQETTPVGKLFRSRLIMLGHDQPVDGEILVVTAEEPTVKQGEVAVLLGMIVGAPSINLHDYEGTEDSVIWGSVIGPAQLEGAP
jgi:hypothetical protein